MVLLWALLTLGLAPAGATLHVMSHIGHSTQAAPDGSFPYVYHDDDDDDHDAQDAQADGGHAATGAQAHCHTCDEWQSLDHAFATTVVFQPVRIKIPLPLALPMRTTATARAPWILPRAPPARVRAD